MQGDEPGLFWSTLTEDEEGLGAPFPVEEHVPTTWTAVIPRLYRSVLYCVL